MPAPTSDPARQQIWSLARQGQAAGAIAARLRLPPRTVRRLLAAFRSRGEACGPDYSRCGRPAGHPRCLRELAPACRRPHPGWGARRILVEPAGRHRPDGLPGPATVCRWLGEAGLAPGRRPPPPPAPPAGQPHEAWQMDAAECAAPRPGRRVSWLRLVGEASGAAPLSRVFARGAWAEVGGPAVRQALREAFARWGRPGAPRAGNGTPWVSPGGLPTGLEPWLAGLGVAPRRNRPGRPQQNGRVGRSQRAARAWAEPGSGDAPEQRQRRPGEEDRVQRELYPLRGGGSRPQAFPALCHSGRGCAPGPWEEACWDLEAALGRLAGWELPREVGRDGDVSPYDHRHRVGKAWSGRQGVVRLAAASRGWPFAAGGREVGRSASRLGADAIRGLRLCRRPGRSARRTRAKRQATG